MNRKFKSVAFIVSVISATITITTGGCTSTASKMEPTSTPIKTNTTSPASMYSMTYTPSATQASPSTSPTTLVSSYTSTPLPTSAASSTNTSVSISTSTRTTTSTSSPTPAITSTFTPNISSTETRTFTISTTWTISVTSTDTQTATITSTTNLSVTVTPTPVTSGIFCDTMEAGAVGWTKTGLWHIVDTASANICALAHSPSHSFWYGLDSTCDYFTFTSANAGSLISPAITLPSSGPITLGFWYWYDTEDAAPYDARWIKIKVGATTTNHTLLVNNPATMFQWHYLTLDISSYANQTINIVFYFDTLDMFNNNAAGWYIDDVCVF